MTNLLFGVSYLGTNYCGWQKQDNALAIEEVIENAIYEITNQKVDIFASGRTDAGVHAIEQCFNAKLNFEQIKKLPMALNSKLPQDIRILWVKQVDNNFHARYSAHKKTYVYKFCTKEIESPFDYDRVCYISCNLNYEKMKSACSFLVGKHDFSAFCSANTTVKDFEREIYDINLKKDESHYELEICGNGFLYNMVRIIVGTIIDVGRGKLNPEDIKTILTSKDRQKAGKTMPAHALYLKKVEY